MIHDVSSDVGKPRASHGTIARRIIRLKRECRSSGLTEFTERKPKRGVRTREKHERSVAVSRPSLELDGPEDRLYRRGAW